MEENLEGESERERKENLERERVSCVGGGFKRRSWIGFFFL